MNKEVYFKILKELPEGVKLAAVSKFHPMESIEILYAEGQRLFAESRVQELMQKYEALPKDIEWHMIGHLQTNKVKYIVPFISMIESVDSARLLLKINEEAEKIGRIVDCLLEVHVAQEETKTGWNEEELFSYIQSTEFASLKNIRLRGIMGMASNTDDVERIKEDFRKLSRIKSSLENCFDSSFDTLSMGMSQDYREAIEEGSTLVRIGSMIFGERHY